MSALAAAAGVSGQVPVRVPAARQAVGVVPVPVLVQVVTSAGRRCECTGVCGRRHGAGASRCPAVSGRGLPLVAAPRDPGVPAESAWRVPVEGLAAWCGRCLDGARRRAVVPVTASVGAAAGRLVVLDVAGAVSRPVSRVAVVAGVR